ncbi:MAG: M20 family metallo-hydrolase [Planctomycetota bacterium]|jgi:N-carbamoyl-L-amino-acid hydrolase
MASDLRICADRLLERLAALAVHGDSGDGGVCRLAASDEDRAARDQFCEWLRALGCEIAIDPIGNIFGRMAGSRPGPPVMTGSHLDTVTTGGRLDGAYGVIAGLEVLASLQDAGITPARDLSVAAFTNEEGVRFTPDMMGSLVLAGGYPLEQALLREDPEGATLGEELRRIGYAGAAPMTEQKPCCFVELHIEQGPVLEAEGKQVAVVENLQGISWTQIEIKGQANHAGTTPMSLRRDAGFVAGSLARFLRELAEEMGPPQVATCGRIELEPNVINVIPRRALVSVDLRNVSEDRLQAAEARLQAWLEQAAEEEGVAIETERLARFEPVQFDAEMVEVIANQAESLGLSSRRMTSGAGHDAQMMARICPAAMIFVPSVGGVSHSPREQSLESDLVAGAELLLQSMLALAESEIAAER